MVNDDYRFDNTRFVEAWIYHQQQRSHAESPPRSYTVTLDRRSDEDDDIVKKRRRLSPDGDDCRDFSHSAPSSPPRKSSRISTNSTSGYDTIVDEVENDSRILSRRCRSEEEEEGDSLFTPDDLSPASTPFAAIVQSDQFRSRETDGNDSRFNGSSVCSDCSNRCDNGHDRHRETVSLAVARRDGTFENDKRVVDDGICAINSVSRVDENKLTLLSGSSVQCEISWQRRIKVIALARNEIPSDDELDTRFHATAAIRTKREDGDVEEEIENRRQLNRSSGTKLDHRRRSNEGPPPSPPPQSSKLFDSSRSHCSDSAQTTTTATVTTNTQTRQNRHSAANCYVRPLRDLLHFGHRECDRSYSQKIVAIIEENFPWMFGGVLYGPLSAIEYSHQIDVLLVCGQLLFYILDFICLSESIASEAQRNRDRLVGLYFKLLEDFVNADSADSRSIWDVCKINGGRGRFDSSLGMGAYVGYNLNHFDGRCIFDDLNRTMSCKHSDNLQSEYCRLGGFFKTIVAPKLFKKFVERLRRTSRDRRKNNYQQQRNRCRGGGGDNYDDVDEDEDDDDRAPRFFVTEMQHLDRYHRNLRTSTVSSVVKSLPIGRKMFYYCLQNENLKYKLYKVIVNPTCALNASDYQKLMDHCKRNNIDHIGRMLRQPALCNGVEILTKLLGKQLNIDGNVLNDLYDASEQRIPIIVHKAIELYTLYSKNVEDQCFKLHTLTHILESICTPLLELSK